MARPANALIAVITLLAGFFLSSNNTPVSVLMLTGDSIAFIFAIAFANIHNDILDIESDKVNRKNRPLPSGKVTCRMAYAACTVSFVCAMLSPVFSTVNALLHAAFYTVLFAMLFAYNKYLKHIPLIKNITVAFLCTTPLLRLFFYKGFIVQTLYPALLFAFVYTLAREIVKDLEDMPGDLKASICTFPIVAGKKRAQTVVLLLIAFAYFSLPIPILLNWYPALFLLTLLPFMPLSFYIYLDLKKERYGRASKLIKLCMVLGLLTLIAIKVVFIFK